MAAVNMAIPLILICFLVKNTIKKYLGDIILYESFPKVSYISYFYYMQLLFMQPFFSASQEYQLNVVPFSQQQL